MSRKVRGFVLPVLALMCLQGCSGDEADGTKPAGGIDAGISGGAGGSGGGAGGATGGTSGGGSGGTTGGTGGTAGSTAGTGGASTQCNALHADVEAKLAEAQKCTNASNQECKSFVEGVCCQEAVNDATSAATQAYLDALQSYKASCTSDCPPSPCPSNPSYYCYLLRCQPA